MSRSFEVKTFGRDCMGNISGYKVMEYGHNYSICHGTFVGDIYVQGSFAKAKADAMTFCEKVKENSCFSVDSCTITPIHN